MHGNKTLVQTCNDANYKVLNILQVDFTAKPTYWKALYPPIKAKLGELLVSLTYHPAKNTLTIFIMKAKNLKAKDINGKSGAHEHNQCLYPYLIRILFYIDTIDAMYLDFIYVIYHNYHNMYVGYKNKPFFIVVLLTRSKLIYSDQLFMVTFHSSMSAPNICLRIVCYL